MLTEDCLLGSGDLAYGLMNAGAAGFPWFPKFAVYIYLPLFTWIRAGRPAR